MKPNDSRSGSEQAVTAERGPSSSGSAAPQETEKQADTSAEDPGTVTKPLAKIPPILLEGDEFASQSVTGPGHKFASGAAATAGLLPTERELPAAYGTGRFLLAARDPHCLYAHWDLTTEQLDEYAARAKDHALAVKVHLENLAGQQVSEIHVEPGSRHSFIHVDQAGAKYVAELGYYDPNVEWQSVASSEVVSTPADKVAEEKSFQFATISRRQESASLREADASSLPQRAATAPVATGSLVPHLASPPTPVRAALPSFLAAKLPFPGAAAVTLPTQGRFHTEHPYSLAIAAGLGPEPSERTALPSSEPSGEWTLAQEHALAELIGWTLHRREWPGSAEIAEVIRGQPSPSSLQPLQPGLPALSESISSPTPGELPKPRGFWLNLNAELVLYGATESDAQVTLAGRPIQLRPDGTFSFRFALPDGHYALPITAFSTTGEARWAELEFYRGTQYHGEIGAQPQDPLLAPPPLERVI